MTNTSLNKIYIPKNNTKFSRGANMVSSWGGGGGIKGQILPKFAISRIWGYDFSIKLKSIKE